MPKIKLIKVVLTEKSIDWEFCTAILLSRMWSIKNLRKTKREIIEESDSALRRLLSIVGKEKYQELLAEDGVFPK